MRYEVTYYYSVPKKKSPLGPICVVLFIIFVIAAANDDKKKAQPSHSDPTIDTTQLPVVTPEAPSATDYRQPHYYNSDRLH